KERSGPPCRAARPEPRDVTSPATAPTMPAVLPGCRHYEGLYRPSARATNEKFARGHVRPGMPQRNSLAERHEVSPRNQSGASCVGLSEASATPAREMVVVRPS